MSIGEFSNLYRDKEVVIRPEYQRLFRWTLEKKSRLIESILLDIPLPSIFVAVADDGTWEVVDGLQRLSTLFEFMGMLRDEGTGETVAASSLLGTKYLPSLEGKYYDNPSDAANSFSVAERLAIKRSRLDVRILLRDTDPTVKFELFDRLNSGGQPTSEQEVRSAQLLMSYPEFFRWLDEKRNVESFLDALTLTHRQTSEQYDLELALRFFVLMYSRPEVISSFSEFDSLLSDQANALAIVDAKTVVDNFSLERADDVFRRTFAVIGSSGINVFRRYDMKKEKFSGGFVVSAFEAVTIGIARNIDAWEGVGASSEEALVEACKRLWSDERFQRRSGAGVRASQRIPQMIQIAPEIIAP